MKNSTLSIAEMYKSLQQDNDPMEPVTAYDYANEIDRLRIMRQKLEKKNDAVEKNAEIIVKEKKSDGYSDIKTYCGYFKTFHRRVFFMVLVFYVIFTTLRLISDFWISWWAQKKFEEYLNRDYSLIYGYMVITLCVCLCLRSSLMAKGS